MEKQTEKFEDYYSSYADDYARYRPNYPEELFRNLELVCSARDLAWDCATGNGQAAIALARDFEQVVATDASRQQLEAAPVMSNVEYRVACAEESGLADGSVDLITVAQALQWFKLDEFFSEVQRVLKKNGILAVWTYGECSVDPSVDPPLRALYEDVEDYWPEERLAVTNRYQGIVLPGTEFELPASFTAMHCDWTASEMLGYLRTWSACKQYEKDRKSDPVTRQEFALRQGWGEKTRRVSWPLTVRTCRC